jgi:aryl-alcohol dehydrogenase-like predicted oxidoreductase
VCGFISGDIVTQLETIPLGKTDLRITSLGLGVWQWGDTMMWGYRKQYGDGDLKPAYDATLAAGINFIDTAEIYGRGRSETLLGQFVRETNSRDRVVLATKFAPFPWRLSGGQLLKALRASLNRLSLSQVDLYQIHFPMPPTSIDTWMNAMADAVQHGLIRAVGVSNYNVAQTKRAHAALAKRGIPLASNQVEYSLLQRNPETSGLVDVCRELGVTIIAYSPIGKGMLSGKYTPDRLPPGPRNRLYNRQYLTKVQPLIGLLKEIGQGRGGKTPSQVSLNWLICKSAVPIPGAKNLQQAQDNFGALGWRLMDDEMKALDKVSAQIGNA